MKGSGQIDIDASVRIFLQHPNLPDNGSDEEQKCPREEIKVEGLPNQILRLEIGTSIFDQEPAILSESGLETSNESESEIPDEFNTSSDVHTIR